MKYSNLNGMVNESLESKNNDQAEEMDDSQIGAFGETVMEGMNESVNNLVSKEVRRTGMVDEMDNSVGGKEANSQKDNVEGIKFSYANFVNNSNLDNKLNLIPTRVNEECIEVVIFDEEIVNKGSKKWKLTVCGYFVGYKMSYQEMRYNIFRMWGKFRLKSVIPNVASRLGTPLIMDQITTNMCKLGNGGLGFARVLVDVEARKGLPEKIEIVYKNNEGVVSGNKSVNVSYDWAPPLCSFYKVFGHCDKNYRCRPRSIDEFMEMERNELKKKQESAEFIPVQHRKRGGKKVNINEGNKKENEGIKSKNVMYKPVEKDDSKANEKTRYEMKEVQMNEKGKPKNTNDGDQKQSNGGSNTKRNNVAVSQNQARKRNKFNVLRDYDGNGMQENDRQNELTDDEEDDVIECSGIKSSINANEVVGLDSNIVRGMYTSDKQNEVAKFITDENLQGCKIIIGWNRDLVIVKCLHMTDQTVLCIIEDISSHLVSFVSFMYAANGNIKRRNLWANLNRHLVESHGL
ncbi:hypothetical protein Tco_0246149 [Tanacetum coccineum]